MAEPREIVITLPPGLRLLSLNGREHWAERNRRTKALKKAAWAMALQARRQRPWTDLQPPLGRVTITVEYQPPDKRRRDPDNYAATGKPLIDGLVAAGVLPDDNSEHVAAVRYEIGPVHPRGRVIIRVREIQEQPCAST